MPKSTDRLDDASYIEHLRERYVILPPFGVFDVKKLKTLKPQKHKQGYLRFWVDGRLVMFHRLVYALKNGPIKGVIDHKDGDISNNSPENLRDCCQSFNTANSRKRVDNGSGYTGVVWHKATGKWQAQTMLKGKRIHVGLFACPKEAALAYNYKILGLFGSHSTFNKVF